MTGHNERSRPAGNGTASTTLADSGSSTSLPQDDRTRVSVDPDPWWLDGAMRALRVLAESGQPFTVDELREPPFALPEPHHVNAWGGLVSGAVRQGWLQRVGYVASPAASRHGGVVSLWRGTRRVRGDER